MGYEAAELEQRSVGDKIFIPDKEVVLTVGGIFERTGTQDDGTMFLPMKATQRIFGVEDKLTGIGIKLKELQKLPEFEERLYSMPAIQVISMAQVKGTILNNDGRDAEALEVINEAIDIESENPKAWLEKMLILEDLGEDEEAKKAAIKLYEIEGK